MYKITPQSISIDQPSAHFIEVVSAEDNFKDAAKFRCMYFDQDKKVLDKCSYVDCTGTDYAGWDGNNDFPVDYVAAALGLTLEA